jgi:hypothetical protein
VATSRAVLLPPPPHPRLIIRFLNNLVFTVWGCYPHDQPPTWRTRVSLFFWLLPLDLSGMCGPTSSYATVGIAIGVSGALRLHHHDKVEILSVGIWNINTFIVVISSFWRYLSSK